MSTSLPEKRIKKIKLPDDVSGDKTYEIIPDKMQSNNFQATLPTLTEDATIVITDDITISQTTLPGTASRPETTTTTISLFGTDTDIKSYTKIDNALSSSSKNPVANDIIYNAISNKVEAEDFQELEQIALTTLGILTGEPLSPVLAITDGNYYPLVSDSGKRWKMGKADSATFFKIYDVSNYTSVHLKSVSRAGHILTNTAPSDFNTKVHQLPTQVATWYEAASVSDSEQADVLPKTGYTPYDKDLTTNGKHYLIVYEVNAAQAIEVINGGGYSPIYTSMFTNDGDGTIQGDTYVLASELATVATSGSYNDLSNKPTIPTVSNETISIYNGEADLIDSFTLNQSISKNITLPYIPSQAADVNEYGQKYVNPKQVRQFQTIFGIAPTLLTNINGHDLSGVYKRYPASGTTTIGGYPAVKILNIDDTNLTFDESHNYMRKITGSEFTPTYGDGTVPQFSYIVDGQGNLYKPQWDSTNGLVLYVVNKLALASSIPTTYLKSASVSGGSLTLTNQNNGTTTFTPVVANPGSGSTVLNTVAIGGTNYKLGGGDVDYDFDSTTGILTITVG